MLILVEFSVRGVGFVGVSKVLNGRFTVEVALNNKKKPK